MVWPCHFRLGGDVDNARRRTTNFSYKYITIVISELLGEGLGTSGLGLLPLVETLLAGSLVKRASLHTYTEVLHQEDTLTAEDVLHSVGGLSANLQPIKSTVEIQIYRGGIGVGIVHTNLLSEFAITWRARIGDDDAINSIAFVATALKSDLCCHYFKIVL